MYIDNIPDNERGGRRGYVTSDFDNCTPNVPLKNVTCAKVTGSGSHLKDRSV